MIHYGIIGQNNEITPTINDGVFRDPTTLDPLTINKQTLQELTELKEVLQEIHEQMLNDGYIIQDGKIIKNDV